MSLKARLALFFALSIGLALFFQGALSYVAFKGLIEADLDRSLLFYARALAEDGLAPGASSPSAWSKAGQGPKAPASPTYPPCPGAVLEGGVAGLGHGGAWGHPHPGPVRA